MMLSALVIVPLLLLFSSQKANGFSPINVRQHQQQPHQPLSFLTRTSSSFRFHSIPTPFDTLTSGLASICRLPRGVTVDEDSIKKAAATATNNDNNNDNNIKIVLEELYNIENDVDCRKVRERITELNLIVKKVICASRKSRVMSASSFKFTVPQLVVHEQQGEGGEEEERDEQQQQVIILTGAKDILDYLNSKFGGSVTQQQDNDNDAMAILLNLWNVAGNYAATALRFGRGMDRVLAAGAFNDGIDSSSRLPMARRPEQPLVLYDYEGNQFCRLVREVLHELDLVYELRTAGKGSPRRQAEMASLTDNNSTQCPFLMDPNTNVRMQESADIIAYLYKTYALWTPPNEQLQWISNMVLQQPLLPSFFAWQARLQAGVANDDDDAASQKVLADAKAEIEATIAAHAICIYTYEWSPFSSQATKLLDNLEDVSYHEISLGREWIPGFINSPGGAAIRAALLDMTGQSSLPHVFVGGKSIGGLFSGTPGLVPALEQGILLDMIDKALGRGREVDTLTRTARTTTTTAAAAVAKTSALKQTRTVLPPSSTSSVVIEETGDFQ